MRGASRRRGRTETRSGQKVEAKHIAAMTNSRNAPGVDNRSLRLLLDDSAPQPVIPDLDPESFPRPQADRRLRVFAKQKCLETTVPRAGRSTWYRDALLLFARA
jgi:hypothetical protein